ncbi:hypothetical protein CCACVL1_04200 [Corchorus capsularis]|uniref:DUF761 domain-containing protein n=1 Tax=Corchorus capsularis TaxID=210143 RepID=A0A1R3JUG7_COCAP|nr:hypothetical protein CCACVL1_04200 [Corchorus capsularis]
MEVHTRTPAIAKRLWKVLRITFLMIRKGLIAKRKLMMDMNLMMKRGKLLRKSLSNLISHHHHHSSSRRGSFGIQEYEFSCSNSPNPVFFHVHKQRKHNNYFPCINAPDVIEEQLDDIDPKAVVLLPKTPDHYTFNFPITAADHINASDQFGSGDKLSPLLLSPFSVRVSNYSSEDDETDIAPNRSQVDDEAEEFIKRFYEQLRAQSRIQLLQYQQG